MPPNLYAAELLEYVRTALTHQVDIDRSRLDIDNAQGALLEASGTFDTSIEAQAEHGQTDTPTLGPQDPQTEYASRYTLGLKKELRSGLTLTPQVETTRQDDGRPQTPTASSSGAYLIATLPLLRGLGAEANAGLERAARQDVQNARAELKHTMNQVVREVSKAYWQYVRDYQQLQQYRKAEQRAEELFRQTKALVEADELPAAELEDVRANLSKKATTRITSNQAFLQSRQNLGLALGIPFTQIRDLPPPQTDFEQIHLAPKRVHRLHSPALIEQALANRNDLYAAKGRIDSAQRREKFYENQLLPRVNLGMKAGYEGLEEGAPYSTMADAPFSPAPGASWQISLQYEFPVANRQARGRLNQHQVARRQQILSHQELARTVQTNVHTTTAVLRNAFREIQNAEQTIDLYTQSVENQLMKYKMGMGTQIDVITTQDNLSQARLNKISAQYKYAQALTDLRFQTATLLTFTQDQARVSLSHLTQLPKINEEKGYIPTP
ncbi:MAG: TolC family protein [Desulfohalobium sp.]